MKKEDITYASTNRLLDTAGEVLATAQQYSASGTEIPIKKINRSAPKPPDNVGVKAIQLQEDDPSKTALIGTGLTYKEVYHPEWLANPVLILKKNSNEWRMCVDYIDLNKHCPKYPFGLPRIDQVIDSMAGCVLLSFLDCYSGYHQIALKEEDQMKTAFIVDAH